MPGDQGRTLLIKVVVTFVLVFVYYPRTLPVSRPVCRRTGWSGLTPTRALYPTAAPAKMYFSTSKPKGRVT